MFRHVPGCSMFRVLSTASLRLAMYLYVLKSKALRTKKKRACAIGNLGVFFTQQTEHFFTLVKLFVFFFHTRAKSCAVNELSRHV